MNHRTKIRSVNLLIVFVLLGLVAVAAVTVWEMPTIYLLGLLLLLILLIYFSEWWAGLLGALAFNIFTLYSLNHTLSNNQMAGNSLGLFILAPVLLFPFLQIIFKIQKSAQTFQKGQTLADELLSAITDNFLSFETWGIPGKVFYHVSPACKNITGYNTQEFLQDASFFEKIIHPEDLPIYRAALQNIESSPGKEIPFRIIHKDGSIRRIQQIGCLLLNGQNKSLIYRAINLDITEQVLTNITSKQTTQLIEQLSQQLDEMIWVQERDPDRMVYANQPFIDFFQFSTNRQKYNPYTYLELIHPEDTDHVFDMLDILKKEHKSVEFEYRVIHKNGERFWVLARVFPILDENGKHYRDVGIASNITDRKKMALDLRFANETLTQLANNIQELFWIRDRYSRDFIFVNPLFEKYFSTPAAAFHDNLSLYYELIYEDDRIWVQKAEDNLFRNGRKFIGEYRLKLPDESIRWVHTQAYPITNEDGVFYRVVGISEDITAWKKNEEAIKEFAHQQHIVTNLQKAFLKHSEIKPFLEDIFLAVNQLIKVRCCTLLELDPVNTIFHIRETLGFPKDFHTPELFPADNDFLPGFTTLSPDVVVCEDFRSEKRFQFPSFLDSIPLQSCISVSIQATDRIYGVLTLFCEQKQAFSETQITFVHSIANMISELLLRYQTEKALVTSEKQYRELIELQNTAILILSPDGLIQYVNPAGEDLFDTPKDFLVGYTIWTLLDPESVHIYRSQHEKILNGGESTFEINLNRIPDFPKVVMVTAIARRVNNQKPIEIINLIRDITQQKREEDELVQLTMYDSLTGIFNRSYYENEIFRLELTNYYPISIIISDVDGLKGTNDQHGHIIGDHLLVQVSSILKKAFRPADIIARIGGDEFAIIMTNTNYQTMKQMLERIKDKVDQANAQSDLPFPISISIGGATSLKKETLRTAIQRADLRMYQQKKQKKKHISQEPDTTPVKFPKKNPTNQS